MVSLVNVIINKLSNMSLQFFRAVVFKQFSSVGLDKDNILTPGFLAIAPWNKRVKKPWMYWIRKGYP